MKKFLFDKLLWGFILLAATIRIPVSADEFTIATWNMRNFVDEYDNPYSPDEHVKARSDYEIDLITSLVLTIDADVLAVQEVESGAFMERLAATHFPQMNYNYIVSVDHDTWYQNIAVLSRFPLGPMTSFKTISTPIEGMDEATSLTNHRMLLVEVYPSEDYAFLLSVNHFKAGGRGERNVGWRLGQIDFLRDQIERFTVRNPSLNIAVIGDFNAVPGTPEMKRWTEPEKGIEYIDLLEDVGHPITKLYSDITLDYILLNHNMYDEYVEGSIEVVRPYDYETMLKASDHYPVSARFKMEECSPEKEVKEEKVKKKKSLEKILLDSLLIQPE